MTGFAKNFGDVTADALNPTIMEGLATGQHAADDGELYPTVQEAVDAATGWAACLGSVTETVSIGTADFTLKGYGWGVSTIDGGANDAVQASAAGITLDGLDITTDAGGTGAGFNDTAGNGQLTVRNTRFRGCGGRTMDILSNESTVGGCRIENPQSGGTTAVVFNAHNCLTTGTVFSGGNSSAVEVQGTSCEVSSCIFENVGDGTEDDTIEVTGAETKCSALLFEGCAGAFCIEDQGFDNANRSVYESITADTAIFLASTNEKVHGAYLVGDVINSSNATTPKLADNNTNV